jgi:1,4-alpha-glucan branching enzyme
MPRAALHALDSDSAGFRWIIGDDREQQRVRLLSQRLRRRFGAGHRGLQLHAGAALRYRIGVPRAGGWREILNTDAEIYGGSNLGNGGWVEASSAAQHGQPFSLELTCPRSPPYCCAHGG